MEYYLYPQFSSYENWAKGSKRAAYRKKKFLIVLFASLALITVSPVFDIKIRHLQALLAEPALFLEHEYSPPLFNSFQENTAFATAEACLKENKKAIDAFFVVITGYSSTVWQTDSTPFITASGTFVRNGVVAVNFLPIGTKITIPEIYGDKIFIVEDRMHPRNYYNVDIWFPSYWQAKSFGKTQAYIEVLEN